MSPPQRGTRGHHDRDAETPGVERERMPRSWEDIPDTPRYDEVIDWENNSDVEPTGHGKSKAPPTSVAAVSEETGSIIHGACTFRLDYQDRLKVRNAYTLPKVDASRTPTLDSYIRNEIPATTKAVDKELSTIQTHVRDALAPLSAILEGQDDTPDPVKAATTDAVKLLGNASAKISHLRRTKIITQMNKALLPLVEEDSNFGEVAPSLFGLEFAQKSKELVDQVKVRRSTINAPKPFFRPGPSNSRGYSHKQTRGGGAQRGRSSQGKSFQKNTWNE